MPIFVCTPPRTYPNEVDPRNLPRQRLPFDSRRRGAPTRQWSAGRGRKRGWRSPRRLSRQSASISATWRWIPVASTAASSPRTPCQQETSISRKLTLFCYYYAMLLHQGGGGGGGARESKKFPKQCELFKQVNYKHEIFLLQIWDSHPKYVKEKSDPRPIASVLL